MRNFFESDEFGVIQMTEAINTLPVVPNRIGSLGLFEEEGVRTTSVGIEMMAGELRLIPTQPRGVMPEAMSQTRRDLRAIAIPHIPKNDTLMADQVQGVRVFGESADVMNTEALSQVLSNRLERLKAEHELTWEWHRIGAMQGRILDADASTVVVDLFDFFNVPRITLDWVRSDVDGLKKVCMDLAERTGVEARGNPYTEIRVLCGLSFWRDLITRTETKSAFELYQSNSWARQQTHQQFEYAGVVFEPMFGRVGVVPFIADAEAASFCNARIYKRFNAPAPFVEAVNTIGLPLYSKQAPMRFDVGTEIHTNSNPLHFCRYPRTLMRITRSG